MFQNVSKSFKLILVTFTLTSIIPMSISQDEESNDYVSESWGSTNFKIDRLRYTYIINKFKYCCQNFNDSIISPIFSSNENHKWRLEVFPKGNSREHTNQVALYLRSVNSNAWVSVKFSILSSDGNQSFTKELHQNFLGTAIHGYPDFLSHKDLLNTENGLLPDDKLTIICEITVSTRTEDYSGKLPLPKSHFKDDLEFLFDNEDLSDVTLITAGGRTFKAHKAILAARSQVFRDIFWKDEVNKTINSVEIPNLDYKVITEMLRYIYTDETLRLETLATNLLVAAENYKLDGLKTRCENILRANLSIENALDFLILGDKYHAMNLKMEAKHLIAAHPSRIKNSTALQKLILTEPHLVVEILG